MEKNDNNPLTTIEMLPGATLVTSNCPECAMGVAADLTAGMLEAGADNVLVVAGPDTGEEPLQPRTNNGPRYHVMPAMPGGGSGLIWGSIGMKASNGHIRQEWKPRGLVN